MIFLLQSRPLKASQQQPDGNTSPVPPPPKGGKLPPVSTDANKNQTEEILNAILPPRSGVYYMFKFNYNVIFVCLFFLDN